MNEQVKLWGDRIYASDRRKYHKLVIWLKTAEKSHPPEVIAKALERFFPSRIACRDDWWGLLNRILYFEAGKANARAAEAEHYQRKTEVGVIAAEFVEFLKQRQIAKGER